MIDPNTLAGQADLQALRTEMETDPAGLGLDMEVAHDAANPDKLNNVPVAPETTMQVRVASLNTVDAYNACDPYELQGLSAGQLGNLQIIVGFEQIFPDRYPNIVAQIEGMFGQASKSLAAVKSLLYQDGSRAQQMHQQGLLTTVDFITPSDYANARNLI